MIELAFNKNAHSLIELTNNYFNILSFKINSFYHQPFSHLIILSFDHYFDIQSFKILSFNPVITPVFSYKKAIFATSKKKHDSFLP
ncbi:hypothetical protein QFZ20_002294 [Flavobacterium sp. W4I14]|nr:hypothetical protein [Flavobacterium sp. W4I14]